MDLPGHDVCRLWKSADGWQLSGTAIFLFDQMPCCLSYQVSTNCVWQTSTASVSGHVGQSAVALAMTPAENQQWKINGSIVQETTGCVDLDLGFTPATNLIAIRRLSLEIGEQSSAPAAWLDFPDFELKRLEQHYHRISNDQYKYESPCAGYAGILRVDGAGAIIQYPGLWEQEG